MKGGPGSWLLCICRSKHRDHSDLCLFCLHHHTVLWPRVSCAFMHDRDNIAQFDVKIKYALCHNRFNFKSLR